MQLKSFKIYDIFPNINVKKRNTLETFKYDKNIESSEIMVIILSQKILVRCGVEIGP